MKRLVVTFRLADKRCICVNYPLREEDTKETLNAFQIRSAAEKLLPVIASRYGASAKVERVILQTRYVKELK